jgi:hypothetical protein
MKMLKYIFAGILCAFSTGLIAQNTYSSFANEAVLFSQTGQSGTARFVGLGNANTSLGGDISNISGNPAGLGFYNRSAWSISPVIRIGAFNSNYRVLTQTNPNGFDNNEQSNFGLNIQIPNAGVVFHNQFDEGSDWVSGTFGLGYNQKSSFYNVKNYAGEVGIVDGLYNDFVEFTLQPFLDENVDFIVYNTIDDIIPDFENNPYSDLAERTGVLDIVELEDGGYIVDRYDYDPETEGYFTTSSRQTESVETSGGLSTLDLSYGANYKDRLYLGASLNINFISYNQERTFRETPDNGLLNYLEIRDNRILSGAGAGVTVGAIYKPINMVNIGVSYTTPSFLVIEEIQRITMITRGSGIDGVGEYEIVNEVPSYSFVIPQKLNVGASFFISKYGFVTADIEYIDYENAQYSSNQGAFGGANPEVGNELKSTYNVKVGAEGRLGILRLRAGYNYLDNPYNQLNLADGQSFNQGRSVVSAGLGIKKRDFFMDATYSLASQNNATFKPYSFGEASSAPGLVESSTTMSSVRFTIGKTF